MGNGVSELLHRESSSIHISVIGKMFGIWALSKEKTIRKPKHLRFLQAKKIPYLILKDMGRRNQKLSTGGEFLNTTSHPF
jgi:hypothetical protein